MVCGLMLFYILILTVAKCMGALNRLSMKALNWYQMSREEQIAELQSQIEWTEYDLEYLKEQLRNLLDE